MNGLVTRTLTLTPALALTRALTRTLILTLNSGPNFNPGLRQTYERSAIEAWLKTNDTSPATGKRLPSKKLSLTLTLTLT